jgi:multidrug efflux pump subunit AcrA (membrane-fusion protein)
VRRAYEEGQLPLIDVLDAQRALVAIRREILDAESAYAVALVRAESLTDPCLPPHHLSLFVQMTPRSLSIPLIHSLVLTVSLAAADAARTADTVVLDAIGVQNLRIKTVEVEETDFEESVFSLGRIEAKPGNIAAVSSRIEGRVVALEALPGERVAVGAEVAKVESRQPGNPPPVISLTAPLGGIVTHLDVRLGDPVEPSKALLEITDLSEVYAVARVPEHIAGRLKPGAMSFITISALPDGKFEGELLRFGTSADPVGGTIDAIFSLPNPDNVLRPGMRAEFSIVIARRANVVSVPLSALQGEPSRRFVYVKDFGLPNAFVRRRSLLDKPTTASRRSSVASCPRTKSSRKEPIRSRLQEAAACL